MKTTTFALLALFSMTAQAAGLEPGWEFHCKFGLGKRGADCRAEGTIAAVETNEALSAQPTNSATVSCGDDFFVEDDEARASLIGDDLVITAINVPTHSVAEITVRDFEFEEGRFRATLDARVEGEDFRVVKRGYCWFERSIAE